MSEQRHIVRSQILEISLPQDRADHATRNGLSQLFRRRMIPILERVFDRVSQPDRLYRIDRLQVDLGSIPLQQLEQVLPGRFEAALEEILQKEIARIEREEGRRPGFDSDLELVDHFLRRATLPWWAAGQADPFTASLERLLAGRSKELKSLLRRLFEHHGALHREIPRLVAHTSATLRQDLLMLLASLPRSDLVEIEKMDLPVSVRRALWIGLFQAAGYAETSAAENLYVTMLTVSARILGESPRRLAQRLQEPANVHDLANPLVAALEAFGGAVERQASNLDTTILQLLRNPAMTDPTQLVQRLIEIADEYGIDLRELHQHLRSLNAESSSDLEQLLDQVELLGNGGTSQLAAESAPPPDRIGAHRQEIAKPLLQDQLEDTDVYSDRAHDAVYIENAGLVLLWPFIGSLMTRLGLVHEGAFRSEAARHRGVRLLQVLVTAEDPFPEYLAPLPKVLCDVAIEETIDFSDELTPSELAECEQLLTAAIAQAAILRDMSPDSLRTAFLQRRGALRRRDGAWLLQVETESYDVVLTRFPWSWEWIRLPWMETALRVEW